MAFLGPSDVATARCTCKRWAKAGVRTIRVLDSTAHRLSPCADDPTFRFSAETRAQHAADVEALVRLIRRCGSGTAGDIGAAASTIQGAPELRCVHIDEVVPQLHPDPGIVMAALMSTAGACTSLTSLRLSCVDRLSDLAALTRLQKLALSMFGRMSSPRSASDHYNLQDLVPLSQLRSLFLDFKGSSLKQPEALAALPALRELVLVISGTWRQNCLVETPDGAAAFMLSSLRHLTHLRLAGCRRIAACASDNQRRRPQLAADVAAQIAGCTGLVALHIDCIVRDNAGHYNSTDDEELLGVIARLPRLRNLVANLKEPWRVLELLGGIGSSSLDTMVLHSARGRMDSPAQPTMLPLLHMDYFFRGRIYGIPGRGHGLSSLQVLGCEWLSDIAPPLRHGWLTGLQHLSAPVWGEVDVSVPALRQLRHLEITDVVPHWNPSEAQRVSALQQLPKLRGLSIDFRSDCLENPHENLDRYGCYLSSAEVMFRAIARCTGLVYLRLAGRLHHGCTPLMGAGAAWLSKLSNLVTLHYKSVGRRGNLTAEHLAAAISQMPHLQFLLLSARPNRVELLDGEGPGVSNLGSETSDRVFEVPGLPGRNFRSKVINIMQVDILPGE